MHNTAEAAGGMKRPGLNTGIEGCPTREQIEEKERERRKEGKKSGTQSDTHLIRTDTACRYELIRDAISL